MCLTKFEIMVDFEVPDGDEETVDAAASAASPFLTAIAEGVLLGLDDSEELANLTCDRGHITHACKN